MKAPEYRVGEVVSFEGNSGRGDRPIEVIIQWPADAAIYYGVTATSSSSGGKSRPDELKVMGYEILDIVISHDVNCNWVKEDQLPPREDALISVISKIRKEVNEG